MSQLGLDFRPPVTALERREPLENRVAGRLMGWIYAGDRVRIYGIVVAHKITMFARRASRYCPLCERPWARHGKAALEDHMGRARALKTRPVSLKLFVRPWS
jgi:hypothetical protein